MTDEGRSRARGLLGEEGRLTLRLVTATAAGTTFRDEAAAPVGDLQVHGAAADARIRAMDFADLNTKETADLYCDGEKCEIVLPTVEPAVVPQEEFEFSFDKPGGGNGQAKRTEIETPVGV